MSQKNQRLINLRKKFGLSQKELGLAVKLSQSMIARIENGDREPRKNAKIKISKYFNTSITWLFYEDNNDQKSFNSKTSIAN